jgi:VWFA-related protein
MYDAVSQAIPLVEQGQHRKKALLIVSDGRDTSSAVPVMQIRSAIRESEALVYAIGIDCGAPSKRWGGGANLQQHPIPFPFPPRGRPGWPPRPMPRPPDSGWMRGACNDPVDVEALRDLTDGSGGRTEIVREPKDLNPATASIADELSKQYYLGYSSTGKKDGKWHTIRVEVGKNYRVRARQGFVAS